MKNFTLPDGRTFAWLESGNGSPLILIHGWGSSAVVFGKLMTQLPGYHCLAPDLPGYGASCAAKSVDIDDLAADIITWFDNLGLSSVSLLGWSLGGIIAQRLTVRFPERIDRLILVASTPCFVSTAGWEHGLADSAVRALARDFKRASFTTLGKFHSLQFQGEAFDPVKLLPTVELATALGGLELLRKVDLREDLAKITTKTLILHGTLDVIIPISAGKFLAANLPQALLHEVNGCGHAPFRSNVEQVSASICRFLS